MIDRDGTNLGILATQDALRRAEDAGLDLIEISAKAVPPVARIMDYGKYQYQKEKEARDSAKKQKNVEIKAVRVGFNASAHDMDMRAKQADEFLQESGRVQIDFILKGRAKYLNRDFILNRLNTFLGYLSIPWKKTIEPRKGPRGLTLIIEHVKEHHAKNKQISHETAQSN